MTEADFEEIISKNTELKNHDFKLSINWEKSAKEERGKIIKDILAMTNTQDGGNILFGVRDKDYELVGMAEEDFSSLDTAKVNDLLHAYADPKFSCEVYKLTVRGKLAACISVPEFRETPNICKANLHSADNKTQILRAGAVYVRGDDGKSISAGAHEMRELLGRAVIKRGDGLLEDIRRLILGKLRVSEKDIEEEYALEIKGSDDFLYPSVGSKFTHYGGWEIWAYPTTYQKERIPRAQELKKLIESSEVSLRGWNFPHTDKKDAGYFSGGYQSVTTWERYHEGYRAYQSGLFAWKRIFPEDLDNNKDKENRRVLSYVLAIYELTECFLFLKRFYEGQPSVEGVHVKLRMNGLANRSIVSLDPGFWITEELVSKDPGFLHEESFSIVDLKASANGIACRIIQRIFLIFGWDDITEKAIDEWQQKLLSRRF